MKAWLQRRGEEKGSASAALEEAAPPIFSPHAIEADRVLADLRVDPEFGLATADAAARLAECGPNLLRHRAHPSAVRLLIEQFNSPIVCLLLAAGGLSLAVGEIVEFFAIALVLAINAAIGFVMEMQALRSMKALREMTVPTALVRRDGAVMAVSAETLVPGDIAILDAGDVLAADMRIVSSANLEADESALTGESLPVPKSAGPVDQEAVLAERKPMLFGGSSIVRGTGEAVVTATGMATELGRITRLVEEAEPARSPLERHLADLSRKLIWLTLAVATAVTVAGAWAGHELALMVKSGVALAVAAIPEGLPIVATLALARGMLRMARHNALVEELSAVETLGATTVILTDKTGTLTENRMHAAGVLLAEGEVSFDRDTGRFFLNGQPLIPEAGDGLSILLRNAALCSNASPGDGDMPASGDPMEVSLLELAAAGGIHRYRVLEQYPEILEHAFDTSIRMMATVNRDRDAYIVAVKGAPETVFDHAVRVRTGAHNKPFDTAERVRWKIHCDALARRGLRLLAIAGKDAAHADGNVYDGLTLFGVVGFHDPPRADIAGVMADARRAGISVVMVTGDHAATARHVSEAIGLAEAGEPAIEGRHLKPLDRMTEEEKQHALQARIFSRVNPEQKLDLVALHQGAGEVVAMTGDGVNDAPALKKADIGIAMGKRGTQVAREAADLVLRDDAFPTIIHAIREGRTIYTNIRRFATYLLSCNLSEILVVGVAVLAGMPLPLLPLQILFLNLVTDVFPAFALGTVEADRGILNRPPRPPAEPVIGRPQWIIIAVHGGAIAAVTLASLVLALRVFGLTDDGVTTMCFYTLALAQLWHVFDMRNWREGFLSSCVTRNMYVWAAIALCLVILALAYVQRDMASVLRLVSLPAEAWYATLALSFVPALLRNFTALVSRQIKEQ